jgi:HTH-type transcriptional regulator/antitoxin HigA
MKITNNSEYHNALAQIEKYIEKGFGSLSGKATQDLKRLSVAVEAYEKIKFPMPVATTIPDLLEEYMHDNKINRSELSKLLQVPNSTVSEIMTGKKKVNLAIVKKLHQKLNIDGNFLLETA